MKGVFFIVALCIPQFILATGGPPLVCMTQQGGIYNSGTIISYTGGDTVVNRHYDLPSGSGPLGGLMQAFNGLIYGMTYGGGTNGYGTIFSYDYISNNYSVLVNFDTLSGTNPYGSLMQATDGKLYGMTASWGSNGGGTLFSYTIGDDTVSLLKNLPPLAYPYGSVMQASNGNLYGMTFNDGTYSQGTIFEYNLLNNIYTVLFDFPESSEPEGSFIEVGRDTLYGLIQAYNSGTLFRYIISTGIYDTVYGHQSGVDAFHPTSSLVKASDGKLYGIEDYWGANGRGALFSYDLDSSHYSDIHDFSDSADGLFPFGALIQANDGMLYGITDGGGNTSEIYGGGGTIFQYNISTSTFIKYLALDDITGYGAFFSGGFIEYNPNLTTGIKTINESTLTISPNPTNDKLCINTSLTDYTLTISDMTGRSWPAPVSGQSIDVSALPAGVYCLQVLGSNNSIVKKFVKE